VEGWRLLKATIRLATARTGDDGKWCRSPEFSIFQLQQASSQDPEGRDMWKFKPSHAAAADSVKFGQSTQLSEGYLSAYRESDVSSESACCESKILVASS
jgi:hypothetical protein